MKTSWRCFWSWSPWAASPSGRRCLAATPRGWRPVLRLRREWRQPAARIAAFLLLVAVAGWPWTNVRGAFSWAYCATVGAALPLFGFGDGAVHARVLAAPPTDVRGAGDNVTSDADVELSLEGSSRHP